MHPQMKNNVQIFLVLLLAGAILVGLSVLTSGQMGLPVASAQEPVVTPAPMRLSDEAYEFFRQQVDGDLHAAALSYNLEIIKAANQSQVVSGQIGSFKVSITNYSVDNARYILFQDEIPPEMSNVTYSFSSKYYTPPVTTKYTEDGVTTWLIDTIYTGDTIEVTVSGRFNTSFRFKSALNVAKIVPMLAVGDPTQLKAAQASTSVNNPAGTGGILYLPLIRRDPTPTPTPTPQIVLVHHEDFTDSNAWQEFDVNGCKAENTAGQYWVRLDEDSDNRDCLPAARNRDKPESPYRTYGEFEVSAYHSEFQNNASYGLFINGRGAGEYYLYRIWPNNGCSSGGDWQLIRRFDDDETTLISGSCNPNIKKGIGSGATNILRIRHSSDHRLTVYANGQQLGTYVDTIRHLTRTGVGLYARRDNRETLIKFDDYKVYRIP